MAQISRSTKIGGGTTLLSSTTARAADVETDMLSLFNAHNNHDTGSSKWTVLSAEGSSTVPLTVNNSTGTQNIANFQDNGTTVLSVADGGTTTVTATNGGTSKALVVNNGTSTGNILEVQDNGTAVHTVADGGNQTFTGKMLGPDGTKTVPTYSFSGDADCGLYRIGTNNIGLSVNDTKIVDVATTGVTITGTGTISGGIVGTTTNDSAATGVVGEYVGAVVNSGSLVSMGTSDTFVNITSISLTAGDWDVQGHVAFVLNTGNTVSASRAAISIYSGNTTTDHVVGDNQLNGGQFPSGSTATTLTLSRYRISITSTTTVYLKATMVQNSGTPQSYGKISARRVR